MRKLFKERKLFKGGNYMRKYGSLKNLFSQNCMYAKKKEKEIMTIYLQNQENLSFLLEK